MEIPVGLLYLDVSSGGRGAQGSTFCLQNICSPTSAVLFDMQVVLRTIRACSSERTDSKDCAGAGGHPVLCFPPPVSPCGALCHVVMNRPRAGRRTHNVGQAQGVVCWGLLGATGGPGMVRAHAFPLCRMMYGPRVPLYLSPTSPTPNVLDVVRRNSPFVMEGTN
ncbi:hypothetical protein DPEC_G00009780 [Dallia pectoralis]|uniref:Uncharacterized protein n=1 Tax=Dallia pectoralis TaxID=75939 RepID=A0ACC2HLA3_DALPE|nr:hypothetical protein DPEC_G00009780 [Dallia pectoralis]